MLSVSGGRNFPPAPCRWACHHQKSLCLANPRSVTRGLLCHFYYRWGGFVLVFFLSARSNGFLVRKESFWMPAPFEVVTRGRLGSDAVVKLVDGSEVAEFRIAVDTRKKLDSGSWDTTRTDWVDVTVWGWAAAGAGRLLKGQLVDVRGSLKARAYVAKDGEPRVSLAIGTRSVGLVPVVPRELVAAGEDIQPF